MVGWLKTLFPASWWSWVAHTILTALPAIGFGWAFGETFATIAAACMVGYYIVRERGDARKHIEAGRWKKPNVWGVSPEADCWGDLLGPVAVLVGLLIGNLT